MWKLPDKWPSVRLPRLGWPNAGWPIQFKDSAGGDRFVRMDTASGSPNFSYGTGTNISPITNPGTQADPQSFVADGKIASVGPVVRGHVNQRAIWGVQLARRDGKPVMTGDGLRAKSDAERLSAAITAILRGAHV